MRKPFQDYTPPSSSGSGNDVVTRSQFQQSPTDRTPGRVTLAQYAAPIISGLFKKITQKKSELPKPIVAYDLRGNALDSSGNLRHGSMTGTAAFVDDVRWTKALQAGDNGYVDLTTHIAALSSLSEGTIFVRFKSTGNISSDFRVLFGATDVTQPSTDLLVFLTANTLRFKVRNSSGTIVLEAQTPIVAGYHSAAFTMSASGLKVYHNGSQVTPTFKTGTASTAAFFSSATGIANSYIGANRDSDGYQYFANDTLISDVMVYSEVLTAEQVAALSCDMLGILLAGQSNMVGRADSDGLDYSDPRVIQYGYGSSTYTVATDPLDHIDDRVANVGLALSGTKILADEVPFGMKLCLIPRAKGGTGFTAGDWVRNGASYTAAVNGANAIIAQGGAVVGMWWHQGEADMQSLSAANAYANSLDSFILAIRTDINDDCLGGHQDMPVVLGHVYDGVPYSETYKNIVNLAISSIPERIRNLSVVSSSGLSASVDQVHFTANSLREFGVRYCIEFCRLMANAN